MPDLVLLQTALISTLVHTTANTDLFMKIIAILSDSLHFYICCLCFVAFVMSQYRGTFLVTSAAHCLITLWLNNKIMQNNGKEWKKTRTRAWANSTVRAKKNLPSWRQPAGAAKCRSQFLSADGGCRCSAHPSVWHAIYASRQELNAPPVDIAR